MNPDVFAKLYRNHHSRLVFALTGSLRSVGEAEEIAASAFAVAFEKRTSFRGDSSFYTWIYRIAINQVCSNARRKGASSLDALTAVEARTLIEPDLLSQRLEKKECCFKIRKTLGQIPAMYRRALVNHFVRGKLIRTIAHEERVPTGTILSRIFTGKRLLREALEAAPV